MPLLSAPAQAAQMDQATAEQGSLIGWAPCAFRPPYGNYDATLLSLAQQRRMKVYTFVNLTGSTGLGYQVLTAGGRLDSFGAPGYGRTAAPATGLAVDPDTGGYWVLRSDGSVADFHAPRLGSLGGELGKGVRAVAIAASRSGYLVLTSDGGVHNFGAPWFGAAAGRARQGTRGGPGGRRGDRRYWILNSLGGVWGYRAPWYGSVLGKLGKGERVTAIAPSPQG